MAIPEPKDYNNRDDITHILDVLLNDPMYQHYQTFRDFDIPDTFTWTYMAKFSEHYIPIVNPENDTVLIFCVSRLHENMNANTIEVSSIVSMYLKIIPLEHINPDRTPNTYHAEDLGFTDFDDCYSKLHCAKTFHEIT